MADLPGTARMVDAARIKAAAAIALANCFAIATATASGLVLLTGDPEIIGLSDLRAQWRISGHHVGEHAEVDRGTKAVRSETRR